MLTSDRLLPYIPAPVVAAAADALPAPTGNEEKFREVKVVISLKVERQQARRGKDTRYFWTVSDATVESITDEGPLRRSEG